MNPITIRKLKALKQKAEETKKQFELESIDTALLLLMYRELRKLPKSN